MAKSLITILAAFALLLVGCEDTKVELNRANFQQGYIYGFDKSNATPDSLIGQIENEYVAAYRVERPDSIQSDVEIAAALPRRLLEVDVYLKGETEGVLRTDTFYGLPPGGATIDLASVFTSN